MERSHQRATLTRVAGAARTWCRRAGSKFNNLENESDLPRML